MSERILIIEDETAIQSILSELLTDAGYNIEVAGDGLEGITKFREKSFSLVLLDIMMPKIDGYTVCEMIRQESDVPIIMLTALGEDPPYALCSDRNQYRHFYPGRRSVHTVHAFLSSGKCRDGYGLYGRVLI